MARQPKIKTEIVMSDDEALDILVKPIDKDEDKAIRAAKIRAERKAEKLALAKEAKEDKAKAVKPAIIIDVPRETQEEDAEQEDNAKKSNMSQQLGKYRSSYAMTVTSTGTKSRFNGDEVAQLFEAMNLKEVCNKAESLMNVPAGKFYEKYCHLNVGQHRMIVGNMVRAAVKRGDLVI